MATDKPQLLTLREGAEYLRIPYETIRYWVFRTRRIGSYRVGRRVLVKRTDLDTLLEQAWRPPFPPRADRLRRVK